MTFGSLFTGIGGLDLGLERAGMKCVWQVEKNEFCRRVLQRHWPDVPKYNDVEKFCRRIGDCEPENEDEEVICPRCKTEFGECECIGTDQLTDEHGWPDLIAGGDPCQDNSNACRNAEAIESSLGGEFIRIVDQLRPRLVVRENPSTVRKDAPWPWQRFRGELERLGYDVLPFRLRACCAGADYRRDRLFLLGKLPGTERKRLEGDVGKIVAGKSGRRQNADAAGSNRWSATPRICGTTHRVPNRMDRLKSLGNAVCPAVGEWIGRRIMELS